MNIVHPGRRLLLGTVLSLGLFLTLFSMASAKPLHAVVVKSDPAAGATIAQAPTTITVTTAENMKPGPANSNLFVYGPSGKLINQGDAKVALNNPKQMSVNINPEKNGIYVVQWKNVSADDGDPDQGAFTFTVGTAAQGAPATVARPTAPTSSTSSGGTSWLVTAIIGIVTLVIGLGIGLGIGRSHHSSQVVSTQEDEYNKIP